LKSPSPRTVVFSGGRGRGSNSRFPPPPTVNQKINRSPRSERLPRHWPHQGMHAAPGLERTAAVRGKVVILFSQVILVSALFVERTSGPLKAENREQPFRERSGSSWGPTPCISVRNNVHRASGLIFGREYWLTEGNFWLFCTWIGSNRVVKPGPTKQC